MIEYSYTFNKSDRYTGEYASIEEALAEARQEAELYPEGDKPHLVYIGRYKPFKPVIEAECVLEVLQRDAYDVAGDAAEGWLDNLTLIEIELLGKRLSRVFRRWARRCGHEPNFGGISNIRPYDLRTGREI
ncbi:hypothetical protein [Selenomonas sputigena]